MYENKRKPNRLNNYDYSKNGAYFITICLKDRNKLLWKTLNSEIIYSDGIVLSETGKWVDFAINNIAIHYPMISVTKYVIMPDHIHMILVVNRDYDQIGTTPTISTVINQMKGFVTKKIGFSMWQKLFYDRIIRNDAEYEHIWNYIDKNPENYRTDDLYENPF